MSDSPIFPWKRRGSESLGDYRIFKLRKDLSESPATGRIHSFYVLEATDWINVIPVTPDGKVILIKQYRHGTEEITLEIPGGMVEWDEPDPLAAARREMREETGYDSSDIIQIGSVAPNPAFLNNRCHTFLARNVRRVGQQQLDGSEEIEIVVVDLNDVPRLIAAGAITHALVVAAFYWHMLYVNQTRAELR